MQTWRGCLPIIGYFTELQEQHAMTQTSEPAIKPEHNEGERTRGNGAQTTNAECHSIGDNSEHLQFAVIGVAASRSAMAARPSAWWDKLRIQQIAGAATAFVFAGLDWLCLSEIKLAHTDDEVRRNGAGKMRPTACTVRGDGASLLTERCVRAAL
jgi:hypothetical protein